MTIFLIIPIFKLANPRAMPTPITEPTKVCVVEIGSPILKCLYT